MFRRGTVVIQAGGKSSRMGRDKGLVLLDGQMLVERVLHVVEGLCDELIITTNNRAQYAMLGVRTVADAVPGAGALPGLQTALQAATGEYVLVVGCDMPFLHGGLLQYQLQLAFDLHPDMVLPTWEGQTQPFHAVYHRAHCLEAVGACLAQGQLRVEEFHKDLLIREVRAEEVRRFDPEGRTFFNVNTPEELATAVQLLHPHPKNPT
jgi:molybdopterin-guanine dinucleotide biosynthesis protein A